MVDEINISATGFESKVSSGCAYALVTAAHNEELFIEKTIEAVISQTVLPERWVIVSDASVDNTDEIVKGYAERYKFIDLVHLGAHHSRSFASKVRALHVGVRRLEGGDYAFIGNLDADISFETSYFANLIDKFVHDPDLGLAGGFIYEKHHEKFTSRAMNGVRSVAGAVQLFRRECYEAVGGILPLKYGGEDWCAEVMARMKGWRVESFPELKVFHHKPTGTGAGVLKYWYQQGRMDFSLGSDPLFAMIKCLRRVCVKPYVAGALARLAGFAWACRQNEERPVPVEFVKYLRKEQRARLFRPFQARL